MPYLAFDLDALAAVPDAARTAGISEGDFAHGLLRMWAHCFKRKTDRIQLEHVRGFFGGEPARVVSALVVYEFVEAVDAELRVRGADRYLRISKARSAGGKKAVGNLRQFRSPAEAQPVLKPETSPAQAGGEPERSTGSAPALTPSTEHRAPNVEDLFGADAPPPAKPAKKPKPEKPTNPRHAPMLKRLETVFAEERGRPYRFDGGNDAKALAELLAREPDDAEIERRYRIGLGWRGFPACHGIRDLNTHFNAYATPQGATGPPGARRPVDVTRGTVRAETQDHGTHTGEVIPDAL